jgi:two-component system, NarL family, sensor kinase
MIPSRRPGGTFMRLLLGWIQHLLILLPAIATMYVTEIASPAPYIGYVLLAFLLVRIVELAPSAAYLLLPVEMIGFGWLGSYYGGLMFFMVYAALISAFMHFRQAAALVVMAMMSLVAVNVIAPEQDIHTLWMINLIWLALTFLLTAMYISERKREDLENVYEAVSLSNERLLEERGRIQEFAQTVEDYAQVEERGRIATELHDDLGHRLIRVKMMTEAVLQLLDREPDKARRMLEQVRGQMEESMNNMRSTVRKLKPPEESNQRRYALHRLIEDAGRDLQIEVKLEMTGRPVPLYPSIEFVLYRNAQEAITNAVRHGGATAVDIELCFEPYSVRMSVANNGAIPADASYGLGLRGMEERIAMLGGKLLLSSDSCFAITTIIPYLEEGRRAAGGE